MIDSNDRAQWAALHRDLLDRIAERGLQRPATGRYVFRTVLVSAMYAAGWAGLVFADGWALRLLAAMLTAVATLQAGFLGHDVSHKNITASRGLGRVLGSYFMTFLCGHLYPYWEHTHLAHHRHTHEAGADPDIEVDLFALDALSAQDKRGVYRFTTRWQGLLLWPALFLQAVSMRVRSFAFLRRHLKRSGLDVALTVLHYGLWLGVPIAVNGAATALACFAVYNLAIGPCLAVSFLWNHVGTGTFAPDPQRAYAAQRILASRNLPAHPVYTVLFGGLNFHAEHHLAPHVPPARLHEVRPLLQEVLRARGMELSVVPLWTGMREVAGHVAMIGRSVRDASPQQIKASENVVA